MYLQCSVNSWKTCWIFDVSCTYVASVMTRGKGIISVQGLGHSGLQHLFSLDKICLDELGCEISALFEGDPEVAVGIP